MTLERLGRFREALAHAGLEGAFLREGADLEYLAGIPRAAHDIEEAWDREILVEGCFIGLAGPLILLLARSEWSLHAPAAAALGHDVRHVPATDDPVRWLREAAREVGAEAAIAVSDRLGFARLELLRSALPGARIEPASPFVLPLRMRKDAAELARIRAAGAICDRALTAALPAFRPGTRVVDTILELELQLLRAGSELLPYRPGVHVAGPDCAVGWCERPADTVLRAPCAVSVDLIAVSGGYRADVGRTVYVGAAPPGAEDAVAACRRAVAAGVAVLRPGVAAGEVDAVARGVMDETGLGDAFVIPSGHGIGLELHEPPRLGPGVATPVPADCVVTVEVAAWRDGSLSAFWEEDAVVTSAGAQLLTTGPDTPPVVD